MAASKMEHAIKEAPDVVPAIDFNAAKDNIVFQLVNTEQNKEMLRDMPNRSFQDLSIIYRWIVKTDVEGIQSTVIHNSLAEKLGISEEQMFKLAVENTRRIFPPTVKSMNDVIRDMFMKDGMPAEIADMMIGEMPAEQTMWVISNDGERKIYVKRIQMHKRRICDSGVSEVWKLAVRTINNTFVQMLKTINI